MRYELIFYNFYELLLEFSSLYKTIFFDNFYYLNHKRSQEIIEFVLCYQKEILAGDPLVFFVNFLEILNLKQSHEVQMEVFPGQTNSQVPMKTSAQFSLLIHGEAGLLGIRVQLFTPGMVEIVGKLNSVEQQKLYVMSTSTPLFLIGGGQLEDTVLFYVR